MHTKQIHWLFLLVMLPAIISLSLFAVLTYRRDSAALQQQTLQTARALSQVIDRELIDTERHLRAFASSSGELDRGDLAALHRRAKRAFVDFGLAEAVVLTDPAGRTLVDTLVPYGQPLPRMTDLQHIRQIVASREPHISNLVGAGTARRQGIEIGVPVVRDGRVAYVLDAVYSTDRLGRPLRVQSLPAGWTAVVFDRDGVIAARSQNAAQYVGRKVIAPLLARLAYQGEGAFSAPILEGTHSTVVFHRSDRTGFGVGVAVPTALLYGGLRREYAITAAGILLITVLSLFLAIRFGGFLDAQRKADAARREVESRFRAIFEASENGILIADVETHRLLAANAAICAKLGYGQEEMLALRADDLHPPADAASVMERFARQARGEERQADDIRFRCKDGTVFYADIAVSRFTIDGRPAIAGIVTDLTERRRMEAALKRYSEDLEKRVAARTASLNEALKQLEETQFAMDKVGIGILWIDATNGRLIHSNEFGARLLGYTLDQFVGLSLPDIAPDSPAERLAETVDRLRQAGSSRFETQFRAKDGHLVPVEVTNNLVPASPDHADRIVAFTTDITLRKEAEVALRESEARLRLFIEHAPVALAMFDREMRYLAVSRRWRSEYQLNGRELLGRSHYEIFPEISERWKMAHRRALEGEIVAMSEDRFERQDGSVQWLRWEVRPWNRSDGSIGGIVIFTEDITPRKEAEVEIQSLRSEMEHLTRFQVARQTVSAMAHELNQPLNAVASYSGAALRLLRSGDSQSERLVHTLEGSVQQAKRAGRVVRELLTFLNQGSFQTEPLYLNNLVRGALDRIEADGHLAFVSVLEFDPDLPQVNANRLQIEKVLVNLIENGIEAMHGAASQARRLTIRIKTSGEPGMAQVTVQDQGPGIDPAMLNHVFDAFYSTKPSGLGMGLAISRAIVEAHGGQLWVQSEPSAGASFHFTLPFAT